MEGHWKSAQGDLELTQSFQQLGGNVKAANGAVMLNGKLRGDQISFTAGGAQYSGRVNGNTIEGTVKSGGSTSPWKATRG